MLFIEFFVSSFLTTTISVHDVFARGVRSPFSLKHVRLKEIKMRVWWHVVWFVK
jgi:hypothetical protein